MARTRSGTEYAYTQENADGGLDYYDASGRKVESSRYGEGMGSNGYETVGYGTDPETGSDYEYERTYETGGLVKGLRRKRGERRTARAEEAARLAAQQAEYGGIFNDSLGGVSGAFAGVGEEAPSELDLLGGVENADSQLAGAEADAGAIAAQRAALARLSEIGQGGYSAEEAAAMQRMRMETAQQEQSQRQAVQQQMAMRGMAGSGAELAAQLAAQQGGANRANEMQLETQAQAQRRALQALGMQGDLSSGMRGQSFDEAATRSSAADDFTRWNADRRGGAAQQRYANRFGLAQAQSDASGRSAELAGGRRSEVQEQQNRNDDKRTDRTSKIIGSIF